MKTVVVIIKKASKFFGLRFILIMLLVNYLQNIYGQNVSISPIGNAPDNSAALDIRDYTDKGVLIPRISLNSATDITTIPSPANSLLIYNTNTAGTGINQVFPGFYYWDNASGKWRRVIDDKYSVHLTGVKTQSFAVGSYPINTWFKIPFNGIVVDNMGAADIANGRIIVQETGWYQISYKIDFCPQTTHYSVTRIYINNNPIPSPDVSYYVSPTSSSCRTNSHTFIIFLNTGDIVELYGLDSQNSPTFGIGEGFFFITKIH